MKSNKTKTLAGRAFNVAFPYLKITGSLPLTHIKDPSRLAHAVDPRKQTKPTERISQTYVLTNHLCFHQSQL